jgi:hypothetical protein
LLSPTETPRNGRWHSAILGHILIGHIFHRTHIRIVALYIYHLFLHFLVSHHFKCVLSFFAINISEENKNRGSFA